MLEGLERLVELQRLDSQLAALDEEFCAIPGRREKVVEGRAACEEQLESARQLLVDGELAQRQSETALQDQEALHSRLEGQQSQVKSNDAYTALLLEMDHARQAISKAETQILESMEILESGREALATAETQIEAERKRLDAEEAVLETREKELSARISEIQTERESVCRGLEPKMLARYQKILSRRTPALVMVTGEMCTGCRVGIPAQNYIEILKSETLVTCGNCNRILLHPDRLSGTAGTAG